MPKPSNRFADHPIHLPTSFYIPTPMAEVLLAQLLQWLWCGATGGFIVGDARIGKTSAALAAMAQLEGRDGQPIPTHFVTIPDRDKKTIAGVFHKLAFALGKRPRGREDADTIADDLVLFLAESAATNRYQLVCLLVDEFQRLTPHQLNAFAELHDKLKEAKLGHLVVFFIGNSGESDVLLRQLNAPEHNHICGRFYTQGCEFKGLCHHDDVLACLRAYDRTRYPADTGPTITEFFLPDAYRDGWRLESLSHVLWSVYHQKYQRPLQLRSWGMQYFAATVKTLLVDYLPAEGLDPRKYESMVDESIKVSGLLPTLITQWKPR